MLDTSNLRFAGDAWFGIAPDLSPVALLRIPEEIWAINWRLQRRIP
jgi:hypothetical protein